LSRGCRYLAAGNGIILKMVSGGGGCAEFEFFTQFGEYFATRNNCVALEKRERIDQGGGLNNIKPYNSTNVPAGFRGARRDGADDASPDPERALTGALQQVSCPRGTRSPHKGISQ
jgi:hypothetical protein